MNAGIKQLSESIAYADHENPWVRLYFDWVEFPDGRVGRYNRIVECEGRPGVAVLPIWDGRVGLVRQYRYPIQEHVWEIPRGFGASDPQGDAARELWEETGLRAKELIDLGYLYPNSGLLASKVSLFAAIPTENGGPMQPVDHEIEQVAWVPLEELLARIATGEISDSFTIAAVTRARQKGLL